MEDNPTYKDKILYFLTQLVKYDDYTIHRCRNDIVDLIQSKVKLYESVPQWKMKEGQDMFNKGFEAGYKFAYSSISGTFHIESSSTN